MVGESLLERCLKRCLESDAYCMKMELKKAGRTSQGSTTQHEKHGMRRFGNKKTNRLKIENQKNTTEKK